MSPSRMFPPLYAGLMGVALLGMWAMFLATGQTPELKTTPVRFTLHLVAEGLTALACIIAARGWSAQRWWAAPLYLVAMGLLLYAVLQAAGYFIEQQEPVFITMFVLFTALTGGVLGWLVKPQGREWLLVFLGTMLYATVQTVGVFAQERDWVPTVMFSLLATLTLLATVLLIRSAAALKGEKMRTPASPPRQNERKLPG